MRAALLLCALAVACSAGSDGVEVTLLFDTSVSDADLARVRRYQFTASGDKTGGDYPLSVQRAANRVERLVFRPLPGTHALVLDVDAQAADGTSVAHGTSQQITLSNDRGSVSILLSAPRALDMAMADMLQGNGSVDAARPPDLAPHIALVQNAPLVTVAGSPSSAKTSFPVATPPGHLVLVRIFLWNGAMPTLNSVSDNVGNQYMPACSITFNPTGTAALYYTVNAASTTTPLIIAVAATTTTYAIGASEYAGLSGLDAHVTNGGGGTTTDTVPVGPTSYPDELIVGAVTTGSAATSITSDQGFTNELLQDSSLNGSMYPNCSSDDRVVSGEGSYAITWTFGSATSVGACVATFH